jgi:alkylation response protein AidB-like acyl-CoA dehydrogenase
MTTLDAPARATQIARLRAAFDEPIADALLGIAERDIRARVREVAAADIAPRASEVDRTSTFPQDSYQALARAGLGGLSFPVALGGGGATTLAYAVAVEEVAAVCAATSLVFMTQMHAAYPIYLAGSDDLRTRFIPGICRGEIYGSLAITEPDAGSDVAGLRTTARRAGEQYVLNGSKTFITAGDRADVIICFATLDRSLGRRGITAFVIEGDSPGLTRGQPFSKMGMHGSSTAELFFDDVRVPATHRLGAEGGGWSLMVQSVVKSRISAAAQGVGLASGAFAAGLAAVGELGIPDNVTSYALARQRTKILQGRLLLYATAGAADRDVGPSTADIAMMKLACTDLGVRTSQDMTGLLGWAGDLSDFGVERYLRDARVTQIYDGTNEVQNMLISRDIRAKVAEA